MSTTMPALTHLDERGAAHMVDVSVKGVTAREAVVTATVVMAPESLDLIIRDAVPQGNVFSMARLAGIMASKQTASLIPLCHPLPLDAVSVELVPAQPDRLLITVRTKTTARTGVEMEAFTAATMAGLMVMYLCLTDDRSVTVTDVRLEEKSGGRSGHWRRARAEET